jgi:hypothetical protein
MALEMEGAMIFVTSIISSQEWDPAQRSGPAGISQ